MPTIKETKKDLDKKIENVIDSATLEARTNSKNFIQWWINDYPEENAKITLEVKKNRNLRENAYIILKRMNE